MIGAVASFFIAKELFSDPMHHLDQELVMNGSQSGDSIASTISNQSSHLLGRRLSSPPRLPGAEKSLISYIPQFNPFATRRVGSVERPKTHIVGSVHLPTELTPLNGEETKSNGSINSSHV